MSENPFEAPESSPSVTGILSGSREDLVKVAKYQRTIIVCILIYFIAVFAQFAIPPEIRFLLGIAVLFVGLTGAVFVFMLAMKVYGTGLGIVLGLLALVPLIGLLILLIVSGKATGILQENGIHVGLLGADSSSI